MKSYLISMQFILMAFLFNPQVKAQKVESAVICKSIKNLEPVGQGTSFRPGEKVYCWAKLSQIKQGGFIYVEWYLGQHLEHSQELSLPHPVMRTYCHKTVNSPGNWKAIIRSSNKLPLKIIEFSVR